MSVSLLFMFMALLLLFNGEALAAAREALSLWAGQVAPALFPFFICTDLMRRLGSSNGGRNPYFLMSLLAGAPSGARLCAGADFEGDAGTELVAACNVISPMFISGAFCGGMLRCPRLAAPILLSVYLSALIMLLRRRSPALRALLRQREQTQSEPFCAALGASIYGGVNAMLSVGGVILCYRVLLSLAGALWQTAGLPPLPPILKAVLFGMLEVVNGSALLSALPLRARDMAALAAFLFSFGGVCIMTQSMQFCQLRARLYILSKLAQGMLAALFAYLITPLFPLGARDVFYTLNIYKIEQTALSALAVFIVSSFSMLSVWLWCAAARRPIKKKL